MNAILALLQYLPAAINAGITIKDIIQQTTGKVVPATGAEVFATQVLKTLPNLIAAGLDVAEVVTRTNAAVQAMLAENRGPTDAEWADQAARIKALEAELDTAAKA